MSDEMGGFEVVYNRIPELSEAIHKAIGRAVRKAAFDIQAEAQRNVPVRTGFLKSSIYVVTKDTSTYGKALNKAFKGGHDVTRLLDEVEKPEDDETAYVAVGAEYGVYVEYGTCNMSAQPYLTPAFDAVKPAFLEALSRLEEKLVGVSLLDTSEIGDDLDV